MASFGFPRLAPRRPARFPLPRPTRSVSATHIAGTAGVLQLRGAVLVKEKNCAGPTLLAALRGQQGHSQCGLARPAGHCCMPQLSQSYVPGPMTEPDTWQPLHMPQSECCREPRRAAPDSGPAQFFLLQELPHEAEERRSSRHRINCIRRKSGCGGGAVGAPRGQARETEGGRRPTRLTTRCLARTRQAAPVKPAQPHRHAPTARRTLFRQPTAPLTYSSICIPISTTRLGGILKNLVLRVPLRAMKAKMPRRQRCMAGRLAATTVWRDR